MNRNKNALDSSTKGYCHEIFAPHSPHLPPRTKKDRTGTSSNGFSLCPQKKHREPPKIRDSPVFRRKTMTLAKLPKIRPKINTASSAIALKFTALRRSSSVRQRQRIRRSRRPRRQ